MGELNSGHGALGTDELSDSRQRRSVFITPDAKVATGDPSVPSDGCGLNHDERNPTSRPAAQMDQVPIVCESVPGDVLAHGRHHDTVAERHSADRERAEKVDLGHLAVVIGPG